MKQILIILFKNSAASCDKHYLPTPVTTDLCREHPPLPCCSTAGETWEAAVCFTFHFQNKFKKKKKKCLSLLCLAEQLAQGHCWWRSAVNQVYLVNVFSKSGRETEMWEAIVQKEVVEISILWEIKWLFGRRTFLKNTWSLKDFVRGKLFARNFPFFVLLAT